VKAWIHPPVRFVAGLLGAWAVVQTLPLSGQAGGQVPPRENAVPLGVTTVFVVRHAEKAQAPGSDPSLSAEGQARARALARVLDKARIAAVYTTATARARQTVQPAAEARGLTPVEYGSDLTELARVIVSQRRGQRVLVAGHSNTIAAIAQALGADSADCVVGGDAEYDNLCVVTIVAGGPSHGVNLRYGSPSP